MQDNEGEIVVGVDGSASSVDALRWALRQAARTGDHVKAVIAWDYPNMYGYPLTEDVDWEAAAGQTLDEAVQQAAGTDHPAVTSAVMRGNPTQVLVQAAAGAELLVVGNRGHGGFTEMLLGSVSSHVVAHATCPVLVVRHHQDASQG